MSTSDALVAEITRRLGVKMVRIESPALSSNERRDRLRFTPLQHVAVSLQLGDANHPDATCHGILVNISAHGACIALDRDIPTDIPARLIVITGDAEPELALVARIKFCSPPSTGEKYVVGLLFDQD